MQPEILPALFRSGLSTSLEHHYNMSAPYTLRGWDVRNWEKLAELSARFIHNQFNILLHHGSGARGPSPPSPIPPLSSFVSFVFQQAQCSPRMTYRALFLLGRLESRGLLKYASPQAGHTLFAAAFLLACEGNPPLDHVDALTKNNQRWIDQAEHDWHLYAGELKRTMADLLESHLWIGDDALKRFEKTVWRDHPDVADIGPGTHRTSRHAHMERTQSLPMHPRTAHTAGVHTTHRHDASHNTRGPSGQHDTRGSHGVPSGAANELHPGALRIATPASSWQSGASIVDQHPPLDTHPTAPPLDLSRYRSPPPRKLRTSPTPAPSASLLQSPSLPPPPTAPSGGYPHHSGPHAPVQLVPSYYGPRTGIPIYWKPAESPTTSYIPPRKRSLTTPANWTGA